LAQLYIKLAQLCIKLAQLCIKLRPCFDTISSLRENINVWKITGLTFKIQNLMINRDRFF
jgi:hypothetical protein